MTEWDVTDKLMRLDPRDLGRTSDRIEWAHLATVIGGPVRLDSIAIAARPFDPYAAFAEVRVGSTAIPVAGSGAAVRELAQRMVGGVDELAAPRALTSAEHAIWALVIAAALVDAGVGGEVWPLSGSATSALARDVARTKPAASDGLIGRGGLISEPSGRAPLGPSEPKLGDPTVAAKKGSVRKVSDVARGSGAHLAIGEAATTPAPSGQVADRVGDPRGAADPQHAERGADPRGGPTIVLPAGPIAVELAGALAGIPFTAIAWCPAELLVRVPPSRPVPAWEIDLPIVVGRCALPREAVAALQPRDVITVDRVLELHVGDGSLGLHARSQAVEATVATGYVRRDMALPDDAHLELTVRLGTTRMSLRRLGELAVGEVIGLGKPLAGPYEIHVGERAIGQGELVDLDGEIGVRIVSLTDSP